jgi:hypothetical protein
VQSNLEAIVMGAGVTLAIGVFSYAWGQISLWRRRSELIEVTAQVLRVQADGSGLGGALVRVRYSLDATPPPSEARRRPVLSRLRQPEVPGGPWLETTLSSTLLQERGTDHVRLLMHPDRPRRVTGRPIVSLYVGILGIAVAAFLALAGWVYFSDLVR